MQPRPQSLEEATRRVHESKDVMCVQRRNKTMVEMTAMSNYTGLIPDVIGGRGPKTVPGTEGVKELNDIFKLKEDGRILNKHGVVEYVNGTHQDHYGHYTDHTICAT